MSGANPSKKRTMFTQIQWAYDCADSQDKFPNVSRAVLRNSTAALVWPQGELFSCHSIKNYWFRHCTVGLKGSVKLMLASLLSKIPVCPVRLPEVSSACRSTSEKRFAHLQPSVADPLLPCTAHLPSLCTLLFLQSTASGKLCSNFFHLSLTSGCRALATNQLVT